jgi:fluoride ion exporter CrcB/FEX
MDNELYKHFSSYIYMCVNVVGFFVMDLMIMLYHNKYKSSNFCWCAPHT